MWKEKKKSKKLEKQKMKTRRVENVWCSKVKGKTGKK